MEKVKTMIEKGEKTNLYTYDCKTNANNPPKSNKKYLGAIIQTVEGTQEDKGVIIAHHYYSVSDCSDKPETVSNSDPFFFTAAQYEDARLLGGKTRRKSQRRTRYR